MGSVRSLKEFYADASFYEGFTPVLVASLAAFGFEA